MHCGWAIRNMLRAGIETAVKPTWTELHVQRLRWNGGITETLLQYGWTLSHPGHVDPVVHLRVLGDVHPAEPVPGRRAAGLGRRVPT